MVEDQIPVATMREIEVENTVKGAELEEKTGGCFGNWMWGRVRSGS